MRRELFIHLSFWFSFFVLLSLIKHFLSLSYWPFWVGGLIGVILPDLDHLIYVYFIKPTDLSSQRVNYLVNKKQIWRSIQLLYETRSERRGLVFHTIFFQVIFLVLTFWIMSSSASLFGRGLVLSFALHISIDQLVDLVDMKHLGNWLKFFPVSLDLTKSKIFWSIGMILVLIMGFLM
jgi:hypothetical protein